jgi:hypothetical protein
LLAAHYLAGDNAKQWYSQKGAFAALFGKSR